MPTLGMMGCCGMKEINNLQQITKPDKAPWSAKAAMEQFLYHSKIYAPLADYHPTQRHIGMVHGLRPDVIQPSGAHIVFTDAHEAVKKTNDPYYSYNPTAIRYGKAFAKFILKNKLGTIIATKQAPNPNYLPVGLNEKQVLPALSTYHMITCYIWTVNWPAVKEWAVKNCITPYVDGTMYVKVPEWSDRLIKYWAGGMTFEKLMGHTNPKSKAEVLVDKATKVAATATGTIQANMLDLVNNLAAPAAPPPPPVAEARARLGQPRW